MGGKPQTAFSADGIYRTPLVDPKTGMITWAWTQNFQLAAQQLAAPVSTAVPASSMAPTPNITTTGMQLAADANYLYVSIGAGQWKRIPLSSF